MLLLLLASISGVASLVLTGAVRAYALRRGLLDQPNARSSHNTPTPRGGGLAVLAASAIGMVLGVAFRVIDPHDALTLGCGMAVLGAIGWLDDSRGLRARYRLLVHLAVAGWTLYMFGGLPYLRVGSLTLSMGPTGYIIGVIGIVWSINLFNFMDGIDGLAGSQAVLLFSTVAILMIRAGNVSLGTLATVIAATSAGFLGWNWPPARIFLGDVGSGPIGYLVAALAIASENRGSVPLLIFAILGAVFVCDATVTLIRRAVRGDRLSEAHRDHAYQRLTRVWGSHRSVTVSAAALTGMLAVLGAAVSSSPRFLLPAVFFAFGLVAVLIMVVERVAPL